MTDYECLIDLIAILLGGCDEESGAHLGPILWDFKILQIKFTVDKRQYCLGSTVHNTDSIFSSVLFG